MINGFSPTPAELAWATRVLEASEVAREEVTQLEGKMIDKPVERASVASLRF